MNQFNKMFNVGTMHGHEDRVSAAITSTNTPPSTLYGLRKDHKLTTDFDKGPLVRSASDAPAEI